MQINVLETILSGCVSTYEESRILTTGSTISYVIVTVVYILMMVSLAFQSHKANLLELTQLKDPPFCLPRQELRRLEGILKGLYTTYHV